MDQITSLKTKYKLIAEIYNIARASYSAGVLRPHKLMMLLAVLELMEQGEITENEIYYDSKLTLAYESCMAKYRIANERNAAYFPFYYLKSHYFWNHSVIQGKEGDYLNFKMRDNSNPMQRLIDFSFFSEDVFTALSDGATRDEVKKILVGIFLENTTR